MAQLSNHAGRFAGHLWKVYKFCGSIYRPTAAKGLTYIDLTGMKANLAIEKKCCKIFLPSCYISAEISYNEIKTSSAYITDFIPTVFNVVRVKDCSIIL